MPDEREWYTQWEAAQFLGVTVKRLAYLRRIGRIKGEPVGGEKSRQTLYHVDELKGVDTKDLRHKQPDGQESQDDAA